MFERPPCPVCDTDTMIVAWEWRKSTSADFLKAFRVFWRDFGSEKETQVYIDTWYDGAVTMWRCHECSALTSYIYHFGGPLDRAAYDLIARTEYP